MEPYEAQEMLERLFDEASMLHDDGDTKLEEFVVDNITITESKSSIEYRQRILDKETGDFQDIPDSELENKTVSVYLPEDDIEADLVDSEEDPASIENPPF